MDNETIMAELKAVRRELASIRADNENTRDRVRENAAGDARLLERVENLESTVGRLST